MIEDYSMKPAPIAGVLTRHELAKLLKVHAKSISRYVKEGLFPAPLMVGRSKRWRVSDVMEFLETGRAMDHIAQIVRTGTLRN